jgi:hypothetical protein
MSFSLRKSTPFARACMLLNFYLFICPSLKCHKLDILMCVFVGIVMTLLSFLIVSPSLYKSTSNLHFVMIFLDLFMRIHYPCVYAFPLLLYQNVLLNVFFSLIWEHPKLLVFFKNIIEKSYYYHSLPMYFMCCIVTQKQKFITFEWLIICATFVITTHMLKHFCNYIPRGVVSFCNEGRNIKKFIFYNNVLSL